ncbi:hypothetical protein AAZX31_06G124700 [Glycine max]|uniref:Knottin scorpion toxin-like domain-containing protein n=2 Tax=Glycine subgen. Soja TaxID=1462606 RepID=A0A0R0JL02_SOYBN|nr:hypothetical protein JHK85_015535 [Glycine max]RZC07261.1 hypothetical protein D0Y65_014560 [Glycine soja]KAG5045771.1 hypothetical protein JHK86_015177 [Glycine max]KAG5148276.1 hypothetical protein JHK82_015157 [Glycine max]KAH1125641.1 hypothetical protein GYH30_014960 [Glycine max]
MTTRRIIGLSFVLRIMYIVFLLTSGSAKFIERCTKAGNCPDEKACYTLCQLFGYKDYGGFCIYEADHECCCLAKDNPPHP